MYRVDYTDKTDALHIMYCFMTIPFLTLPECTVWGEHGPIMTLTNDGSGFISELEFQARLLKSGFFAITCTASTDKADTRRVNLTFTHEFEFMVLNFPCANGNLNAAEKKVFEYLD